MKLTNELIEAPGELGAYYDVPIYWRIVTIPKRCLIKRFFNMVWDDEKIAQVLQQVSGRISEIQIEDVGVTKVHYRGTGFDWMPFTCDGQYAITFKDDPQALSSAERFRQVYPEGDSIYVTVVR